MEQPESIVGLLIEASYMIQRALTLLGYETGQPEGAPPTELERLLAAERASMVPDDAPTSHLISNDKHDG